MDNEFNNTSCFVCTSLHVYVWGLICQKLLTIKKEGINKRGNTNSNYKRTHWLTHLLSNMPQMWWKFPLQRNQQIYDLLRDSCTWMDCPSYGTKLDFWGKFSINYCFISFWKIWLHSHLLLISCSSQNTESFCTALMFICCPY